MKKLRNPLVLIICTLLLLTSCSKDDDAKPSPAEFSINQSTVNFGEVEIPTSKEVKLTVTNTGEQDLVLKDYAFSGSNTSAFTVNNSETETTVEAGKTYELVITYEPVETGEKTALLTITSNMGTHKVNLSGSAVLGPNAIVNIPDANFKARLLAHGNGSASKINKIDTNDDGEIQVSEAQAYEGIINCYKSDISDLTGIEAFVNIFGLEVVGNQLTSLDVSQNTVLKTLNCQQNKLVNLDISQNILLEELHCSYNQLTNLDVSQNTNLKGIYCSQNQITSLDVSQNIALKALNCSYNQLTSLDVSKNTNLEALYCGSNLMSGLDVSKNAALISLYCGNNQLSDIDISNNVNLKSFSIQGSQLTSIDVSQNTNLEKLNLDQNQLSGIDVSNNVNLKTFWAQGNELSHIDFSQNTALETLYLDGNQLSSLDVSNNVNLKTFWAQSNMLTQIDISQNSALERLYLTNNQLKYLNVANGNNVSIIKLQVHKNPDLTCIKIDAGFTPPTDDSWQKDGTANYNTNCEGVL